MEAAAALATRDIDAALLRFVSGDGNEPAPTALAPAGSLVTAWRSWSFGYWRMH
jgi:hypothetical protein